MLHNYIRFSHSGKRRSLVGGRSVPLIPSIVERVRSGPERSRARRFLARRSATLDGEDRCETITEGRKAPSSHSAYPTTEPEFPFCWLYCLWLFHSQLLQTQWISPTTTAPLWALTRA